MDTFPVGRSIARAYGFLFGHIITIVGLSWVPALFYAALRLCLFNIGPIPQPLTGHPQLLALYAAAMLGGLLLFASIVMPLSREALGQGNGLVAAHFVVGAREFRFVLARLRFYVLFAAMVAIGVGAVMGAGIGVDAALKQWPNTPLSQWPVQHIAHVAAVVIVSLAVLFVTLRFTFLLTPVSAIEEHASLGRAWELSRGNFLRILLVVIAVAVPLYAVFFAGAYWLMGGALLDAFHAMLLAPHAYPPSIYALYAAHAQAVSAGGAGLLVAVSAALAGASAAAYRALTGTEEMELAEESAGMIAGHGHDAHGHDDHGHGGHGHDDHGHGGHGHDDHGHGSHGHDDHGHAEHAHDDHGHGGHGHDDHGHGGHGHDDHAHAGHDDHGHGGHGHDDHGHGGHGHDEHAHGAHDDHGHGGHGHDDHGHGGHDDHGHGHDDHGHGSHHAHADAHGHHGARVLEHA